MGTAGTVICRRASLLPHRYGELGLSVISYRYLRVFSELVGLLGHAGSGSEQYAVRVNTPTTPICSILQVGGGRSRLSWACLCYTSTDRAFKS